MSNKEYTPKPAVLYINEPQAEGQQVIYNLQINTAELPEADENGVVKLIGFINTYKKKDSQPDVNFAVPRPRAAVSTPARTATPAPRVAAARATGTSGLPKSFPFKKN